MFPINRDPPATEDDVEPGAASTHEALDWTPGCALFFLLVLAFSTLGLGGWISDRISNPSPDGIDEKRWIELATIFVPFIVSLLGTILCVKQIRRGSSEGPTGASSMSMARSVPIWPGCLLVVLFFFVTSAMDLVDRVQSNRIEPIGLTEITALTYKADHRFQLQNVVLLSPHKAKPGSSGIFEDVAPIVSKGAHGGPYLLCAEYDRFTQPPIGTIAYVDRTKDDEKQIAQMLDPRYQWQYVGDFIPPPAQPEGKDRVRLQSTVIALILSIGGFVLVGLQIREAFKKK